MFFITFNIHLFITEYFVSFPSTPFLVEFCIGYSVLLYLLLCCSLQRDGWNFLILFKFILFLKVLFICILICLLFKFFSNDSINYGLYFGGYFFFDLLSVTFKIFLMIFLLFGLFFFESFLKKKIFSNFELIDFLFWFLGCCFFLNLLLSVNDLFCMFSLITGLNICFYGLLLQNVIYQRNLLEACLKYFIFSLFSSLLLAAGCILLFNLCGTCNFILINNFLIYMVLNLPIAFFMLFKLSFFFILCGFLFKLTIFPAHFWAAEVYEGLPLYLLYLIMVPIKFIFCIIFIRIFRSVFNIFAVDWFFNYLLFYELENLMIFISFCSLVIGGLNAFFEIKINRFLAYSSINQISFLVFSCLGFTSSFLGIQIALFFIITYLISLLFFFCLLWFYNEMFNFFLCKNTTISYKQIPLLFFTDFTLFFNGNFYLFNLFSSKGLWVSNFLPKLLFYISFLSFAGIPPFPGFYTKFYVLIYIIKINYFFLGFIVLMFSLISAFYYLNILRLIFFDTPTVSQTFFYSTYNNYFYIFKRIKINMPIIYLQAFFFYLFFLFLCSFFFFFFLFNNRYFSFFEKISLCFIF